MKRLHSVELHQEDNHKYQIWGTYIRHGQTRFTDDKQDHVEREPLTRETSSYLVAKDWLNNKSKLHSVPKVDFVELSKLNRGKKS